MPTLSGRLREWVAFGLLALLFGSAFLWTKLALAELGPLTVIAGRLLLGLVGLAPIVVLRRQTIPLSGRLLGAFAVLAVLNTALPFALVGWAQTRLDSALVAVLVGTMPLFTILIAHRWLDDERITASRLAGLVVGFGGVVVLGVPTAEAQLGGVSLVAMLAVLGAAASYAAAAVFARKRLREQPPLAQALMVLLIADALAWLGALGLESPLRLPVLPLTWLALTALGLLGSCLAYLLYFFLIRAWDATRAATVLYVVPLVGLGLGVTVLGEALDGRLLASAALVVSGVALTHAGRVSRAQPPGVLRGRGAAMDLNEYTMGILIKQRHADLMAEARRHALLRRSGAARRPLRTMLGTALIRLGAWLLREQYPTPKAA